MIFNQILRLYHLLSTIFSYFFPFPLFRTKTVEIQTMASPPDPDNWRDILEDRSPPTAATTSRVPAPPPPPPPPAPALTPAPAPAPAPAHVPQRAQVVALSNTTVSIKLDESNYLIWRQQVEAVINGHNVDRFLMDPVFPHRFRNRDAGNLNEDRSLEQLLFVWLLSTLSEPIGTRFVGCGNCAELWDEIEKFFKARARANVTQFRIELDNMKKGTEESISEYLLRIKVLIDSLDFADCRLSMREHVDIILDGLPEEYDAFVTAVNVGLTHSNVHQIEPLLLVHEAWLERKKKKKIKQSDQSPVPQSPVHRMSCNTTEPVFLPNQFEFDLRPMQYHPQGQSEIGNQFPLQQQQSSMLQMPLTSVPPPPAWTSPPTLSAFTAPMPMRPPPPGFAPLPRRPNVSYYGPH